MQKKIIALAIAAAISSPAFADVAVVGTDSSSITAYAVLDAAYGSIQHSLATSPTFPGSIVPVGAVKVNNGSAVGSNSSVTGLFNGGISDSRIGFKGTQDLGDGMKAFFVLESGIDVTTGQVNNAAAAVANGANEASANSSLSGQMFNREANVGLSDAAMGSIAAGLNYNQIYDVLKTYDPVQFAQLFSPLGFSGTLGGGGGVSENTRVGSSLKYMNKFGPINVSLLFKPSSIPNANNSGGAINVGYEAGDFGVQAVWEQFNDVAKISGGSTTATGITGTTTTLYTSSLTANNYNTSAYLVSAKYKMGDATVKAGFERYVLSASSDALPTTTTMFGYATKLSNATGDDLPTQVFYIGGDYNLTPATNVAVGYYDVKNMTATQSTANQLGSDSVYVSVLLDHNLNKRVDVYAGAMLGMFSGMAYDTTMGGTTSVYYNSNLVSAVGVRAKF